MTDYVIRSAMATDIPALIDLIRVQEMRQFARSTSLLAVHTRQQVEAALISQCNNDGQPLVVLNQYGKVCAYAHPSVWILKETSILLSFLTARNGIVQRLTFPDPTDEQADTVANMLIDALDTFWQEADTSGDLIRWPSSDPWVEPLFLNHGFRLDSICAFHPLRPFLTARPLASPQLYVRSAHPADEEALLHLFEQELCFHERYTPFVRSSPQVVEAFRRKLQRLWQGKSLEDDAPLVLVAELDHEIVAMAENTLVEVGPLDEPGFTPPGRYWCIDNVSVREEFQGQGIGRQLVQSIEDTLTASRMDLNGYVLWFNPDNPKAASFWPRLGFQPLWTTYQRLH